MNVSLHPATPDTLPIVRNLFVAFFYDLSAYDPNLVINEYGLPAWTPSGLPGPRTIEECAASNWWIRDRCLPYLIFANNQIAGFLHVCADREHLPADVDFELMDFYIAPPFRRQGVGWRAARLAFDAHRGNWQVFELAKNAPALAFWHKRIADYTNGNFQNLDGGTQQCFDNRPVSPASQRTEQTATGRSGRGAPAGGPKESQETKMNALDPDFLIQPAEVSLKFQFPPGARALAFSKHADGGFVAWQGRCRSKLAELLHLSGLPVPPAGSVRELRQIEPRGVTINALLMDAGEGLTLPAYLLLPVTNNKPGAAVLAIHGHGEVEPCVGERDDYHHGFALELAQRGHMVLCPELRGFGLLADLARDVPGERLDYWRWDKPMAYSLVTDAFQKDRTLLGDTVLDLLRWEDYLARTQGVTDMNAVGISYGGDLALIYPVFSDRVRRVFASGTFGSFLPIFSRCYNAPAHCIPGVLTWMDRADIAGLLAPRPVCLHYGALDVPGPDNFSASYNETVAPSLAELRAIYAASGAPPDRVRFVVSEGKKHEMDNAAVAAFLEDAAP